MPTMILHQEVEATPALIEQALRDYAGKLPTAPFPHPPGTMIHLTDQTITAMGAVDGMPVLVLAAGGQTHLGIVAFYSKAGMVGLAIVTLPQIKPS